MIQTTSHRIAALFCLFLCTVFLLLGCGSGKESKLPQAPDTTYLYDEAGVLKSSTRQHISNANETLFKSTGTHVTVACVRTTGGQSISRYARDLFLNWELGSSKGKTGVLLVLCPPEDGYWCLQSRELEPLLPDSIIDQILRSHLEPHFLTGDYDAGVRAAFDALLLFLTPEETADTADPSADSVPRRESSSRILGWAVTAVLLLLLILHFVLVREQTPRRQKRRTVYTPLRTRRPPRGSLPNPVWRPAALPPGHSRGSSAPRHPSSPRPRPGAPRSPSAPTRSAPPARPTDSRPTRRY